MLLQTNSYIVPKDKRTEHARLLQRFRQTLTRLGCEHFEAYEQVGSNWSGTETTGRFVQLMRFKDRKQQQQVQAAERNDATAQALIKEFCELINFPYQQQQGLFAVGFYQGIGALSGPSRQPPPHGQPVAMEPGLVEEDLAADSSGGAVGIPGPAEPGVPMGSEEAPQETDEPLDIDQPENAPENAR